MAADNDKQVRIARFLRIFRLVIPYTGLLPALCLLWKDGVRWNETIALYSLVILMGTGFTVGYHRLFAHRSFEAAPPVKILLAVLGLMGAHLSIIEYAAIHRCHHAFSDRPGDPHSPRLQKGAIAGLWHAHSGWLFDSNLDWKEKIDKYASDLVCDPLIVALDRLHYFWIVLGLILPASIAWIFSRNLEVTASTFVWCGLFRMFLQDQIEFFTRSIAHYFGDRSFQTRDESRNNWIAILSLGEWHNNHHAFPHSANQGLESWQFDFSYWTIVSLERLGLVRNVKRVSSQELIAAKKL